MVLNFSVKNETEARKDFLKSFKNFLSKCPIILEKVDFEEDTVYIFMKSVENPLVFKIDIFGDKQAQIKKIKDTLYPYYPIIYVKDYQRLSAEEIERREEAGESLNNLLEEKKSYWRSRYTIVRVHDQYNEIDVRDNKERETIKFKLKIPAMTFIEKVSSLPREEVEAFFLVNKKFIEVIRG